MAKYEVLGDPNDQNNPFAWDRVRMNLPGAEEYDATLPWVMKLRRDGNMAAAVAGYVDDFRIVAGDEEAAWSCSSRAVLARHAGCSEEKETP